MAAARPIVLLTASLVKTGVELSGQRRDSYHRVNRAAQQRNFVLAFRETRSRSHRLKVFLQLWWLNVKSRDISISNFLFALALFPSTFERVVNQSLEMTEERFERRRHSAKTQRPSFPEQLWRLSPDALRSFYALLHMALYPRKHPYMKSAEWKADLKRAAASAGLQLVVFQVSMALLESIIALIFADDRGSANDKKSLLRIAKEMGIADVSPRSTNDEVRVAIARHLLEEKESLDR